MLIGEHKIECGELNNAKAPKTIDEARLTHEKLFMNKVIKLRTDMSGAQFVELLREQEEFKLIFKFLDSRYPNLRNYLRLLGREGQYLYVFGSKDGVESWSGDGLVAARGPRSRKVANQRIYLRT